MPLDRGIIDQQLQALGESTRWWEEREFRDLPAVLRADENLLALSRGKVARGRIFRRTWLIVVTDQRLLCLRSMRGAGWRQREVGASQILLVARPDGYRLSSILSTLCTPPKQTSSRIRPTLMARRVLDHVLALPAAAFGPEPPPKPKPQPPKPDAEAEAARIQSLEAEIDELREQVRFMEQLVRREQLERGAGSLPPG
jgi:hypothetical protein